MSNVETSHSSGARGIETRGTRRMLRSVGAGFAGVLTVLILSLGTDIVLHATGIYPPWFQPMSSGLFLLATGYRTIYAIAASYITARLAPDHPMQHALVLGLVGVAVSTAGAVATWNAGPELGPKWYPLSLVATALPCAWVGGILHRILHRQAATT